MQMRKQCNLSEGIEHGDLRRLVDPVMAIDEYRSKMGEDKDIIVLGIIVMGKEPAMDLVNFLEKSYDWVLDADVSSGETSDGNYIVFIEIERKPTMPKEIMSMMDDIMNLTGQQVEDWSFTYYKNQNAKPFTLENLTSTMFLTPEEYEAKVGDDVTESRKLNSLRSLAGVYVKPPNVVREDIRQMQIAAGIK